MRYIQRKKSLSQEDVALRKERHNPALPSLPSIKVYIATDAHVKASVDGNPDAEGAREYERLFYTSGQKLQKFVDDVNRDKPDLVLFLGDFVQSYDVGSMQLFVSKWNQIDATIQKEITVGNHDMAWGGSQSGANVGNTDLANYLGYGSKPIIAKSKYNQTFVVSNDYCTYRFIGIDTTMNNQGGRIANVTQQVSDETLTWMETQILASPEKNIIIYGHGSPADDNVTYFESNDSLSFKNIVENAKTQKPELNIINLAGHKHPTKVLSYPNFSTKFKSYIMPPVVDYTTGFYVIANLNDSGVSFETKELVYPYSK